MTTVLLTILALLMIAACFSFTEGTAARGVLLSTGILEFRILKLAIPLIAAALLFVTAWKPVPAHDAIYSIMADKSAQDCLEIALAAVIASVFGLQLSSFTSPVLAVIGAMLGGSMFSAKPTSSELMTTLLPWLIAPIAATLLSAAIYNITDKYIHSRKVHLLKMDRTMQRLLAVAALLFLSAFVFNIVPILAVFTQNLPISPAAAAAVVAAAPILLTLIFERRIGYDSWKFSEKYMDVSVAALLAIILSTAITLALSPAPVSCIHILLASLAGIAISGEETVIEKGQMSSALLSALATFIISGILGYGFGLSTDPKDVLVILAVIIVLTGVLAYLRFRREKTLQDSIILSRQQQIEANQRSLSALEIKAEMTEKDLSNKLELKRKELVDFALGVSEQKQYTEYLYGKLQELQSIRDAGQKEKMLDDIIKDLRERMHSSNEANEIYAQSEILHKDFNLRLRELFPNLTESEKKLANLLRQGFSCKQIASIMNITPKSAEINRYRLRAKLGLKRSDNLINYIKSI